MKTTKQKTLDMCAEGHRLDAVWADARAEMAACEARLSRDLATFAQTGTEEDLAVCRSRFEDCQEARLEEAAAINKFDRYQFTRRLAEILAGHAQADE